MQQESGLLHCKPPCSGNVEHPTSSSGTATRRASILCFLFQDVLSPDTTSKGVRRAVIRELLRVHRSSTLMNILPAFDGSKSLYTASEYPPDASRAVLDAEVKQLSNIIGQLRKSSLPFLQEFEESKRFFASLKTCSQCQGQEAFLVQMSVIITERSTTLFESAGPLPFHSRDFTNITLADEVLAAPVTPGEVVRYSLRCPLHDHTHACSGADSSVCNQDVSYVKRFLGPFSKIRAFRVLGFVAWQTLYMLQLGSWIVLQGKDVSCVKRFLGPFLEFRAFRVLGFVAWPTLYMLQLESCNVFPERQGLECHSSASRLMDAGSYGGTRTHFQ
jgi:hypothetical protein